MSGRSVVLDFIEHFGELALLGTDCLPVEDAVAPGWWQSIFFFADWLESDFFSL